MNKKTILSQFPRFMENWKSYIKQFPNIKEWYIASDYCFDKYSEKPNQVMTFTICPSIDLKWLQAQINNLLKADSKQRKNFSDEEIKFIRDNKYFFSISVIIEEQGLILVDKLKEDLGPWIQKIKEDKNNKNNIQKLQKFNQLKSYLSQKSFSRDLITKIGAVAIILGIIIEFLIIKHNARKVLWISDRGKIIDFNEGIVIDLANMCYHNLIKQRGCPDFIFGIGKENSLTKQFDFDPMIRYPDIVSGVVSSINFEKGTVDAEKHFDMLVNGMASNKRIHIFRLINGSLKDGYVIEKIGQTDILVRASSVFKSN